MSLNPVVFKSDSVEWPTPQSFFDKLNEEFHFTLDVAATKENAKCARFFTKEDDGLRRDWSRERVWCNPPYGRVIADWVQRCSQTVGCIYGCPEGKGCSEMAPELAVMLLPARTDTKWWHEFVMPFATEIRFIKGRLKFGGAKNSAPFPSVVVVFRRGGGDGSPLLRS